jgi:hypothetical protein
MRWFTGKDRALEAFAEAIRPELSGIGAPEASSELRRRILADRAAGARVILPAEPSARSRVGRYLVAAVAVVVGLLVLPLYRASRDTTPDAMPLVPLSFFGAVAHAEQPAGVPRLAPAALLRPERMRARTLRYHRVVTDSTERTVKTAESVVSVAADSSLATAAWRVTTIHHETSSGPAVTSAETVLVRRGDLGLLTRNVHVRPYRRWKGINIEQRVVGDSVHGRMTLDDVKGMRPIARRLPPAYAPFISDAIAPVILSAVPLSGQWQGSLTLLGWAVIPMDVLHPVELRVTGEERVRVPAGTFDCWRVRITYAGSTIDYWVRKSDGIGVRTTERNMPSGGERTVTLVSESGV